MSCVHLFVYGALLRKSRNAFARRLEPEARYDGRARFRGRLYDLGPSPGLVPAEGPEEWVFGELYRLPDSKDILRSLDRKEGARFERITTTAIRDEGDEIDCRLFPCNGLSARPRARPPLPIAFTGCACMTQFTRWMRCTCCSTKVARTGRKA